MFDIGFSELMVILVIALVVIGPERLPKVARTIGQLWARMQRYINKMKSDITHDMELQELKQMKLKMENEARVLEDSVRKASLDIDGEVMKLNRDLEQAAKSQPKDADGRP